MFMRSSKTIGLLTAVLVLSALAACASLTPQTFNESLAAGYTTVTSIRGTATSLVNADIIKADDAQNVQNQANEARKGLDLARDLHTILPKAGQDKLESTIITLTALQNYLLERQRAKK